MSEDLREQIRRLEALVAGPAGALAFAALAEAQRRAGRPEQAERVARAGLERAPHLVEGRIALALALLDQKRDAETRVELERLLGCDAEHAIAHDAASAGSLAQTEADHHTVLDGSSSEPLEVAGEDPLEVATGGELATLDPYPDEPGDQAAAARESEIDVGGRFGLPPVAPLVFDAGGVGDEELEVAFETAESDRDQMLAADDVAHAALAAVPEEEEGEAELAPLARVDVADGEDDLAPRYDAVGEGSALSDAPGSPFATETVAGLLERQGHRADAERLRERIASGGAPRVATPAADVAEDADAREAGPTKGRPARQATLERWLDNLRRDER